MTNYFMQLENFKHLKLRVKSELEILENKNNEYDELGGNPNFVDDLETVLIFQLINREQFNILRVAYFTNNNPNVIEDWCNNYEFEIKHYMDNEWQKGFSGLNILNLAIEEDNTFQGDLNEAIKLLHEVGNIQVNPPNVHPIQFFHKAL